MTSKLNQTMKELEKKLSDTQVHCGKLVCHIDQLRKENTSLLEKNIELQKNLELKDEDIAEAQKDIATLQHEQMLTEKIYLSLLKGLLKID